MLVQVRPLDCLSNDCQKRSLKRRTIPMSLQEFPTPFRPLWQLLLAVCFCGMLSNLDFAAEPPLPLVQPSASSSPSPTSVAQSPPLTTIAWGIIFQDREAIAGESRRQASERRDNLLAALGALRDENNKTPSAISG